MENWNALFKPLGIESVNDLLKANKRHGLTPVQKQITRSGKTFTTTVYVKQGEDPKSEKKNNNKEVENPPVNKVYIVKIQEVLRPIRKELGTEKYKEYLEACGIKWERNTKNDGADTMRASMSAKKFLEAGGKLDKDLYEKMLGDNSGDSTKESVEPKNEKLEQIKKIAEEQGDPMAMYYEVASSGDSKLKDYLKEEVSKTEGTSTAERIKNFYDSLKIEEKEYKEKDPTGFDEFKLGKRLFSPEDVTLEIVDDYRVEGNAKGSHITINKSIMGLEEATQVHVVYHEVGHVISNAYPNLEAHIIKNPSDGLGKTNIKHGVFEGVSYNPEESWAESFARYHSDNEEFKKKNPVQHEFVRVVTEKIPDYEKFIEKAVSLLNTAKQR